MSKYRIIESDIHNYMHAQVWRWYWPFWCTIKGYSTLYLNPKSRALDWCREAIEKDKRGEPKDEPEYKVIE